ncbi:MAG: GDYXXLXY domain-containing protein [Roseitalea sp.]|jgi:uncharacterized membrane-anchored protein|nr:GDYXXLXY domain-containing protein [Oceaniradius stylonematis]MBO6552491.1 GDYXXLXY domain-containing protein [Roseitalea sp.]MBO6950589.1 GDYXXLXY domain-containing protein [Rhizobiaceae bacterium]RNC94989.1 MAG: hypothetical protein ED558_09470 [Oricola sp.]MBO6591424.1 GDYXXLXY domain-containing protein [Roseitalea sp.]MBO6599279.1 GDYXXLXY domain-containing protein [Roseitalea sp.]
MAEPARAKPFVVPAAVAATAVLCAILAWMIESRAQILREGAEIVLKSEPIDPRDLLRGHYVVLTYPAQQITGDVLAGLTAEAGMREPGRDVPVYVTFEAGPDGHHRPVAASLTKPDEGIFLRGTAPYLDGRTVTLFVDYGIGRFYTNEHRAPELEARMRAGGLTEIVIAVGADGTGQIKAFRQAGETIVTEPLY